MQIEFTGHGVDVTDALKNHVKDKFSRLERHFDKIIAAHFTFHLEKLDHIAEATLLASKTEIHASASSEDMYAAVDALVDKLNRQLIKHKEKMSDHRE